MRIERMNVGNQYDLDYNDEQKPEDILRVDTYIIENAVRLIPLYQRGIGMRGDRIHPRTAEMLIVNYYDLLLSALNRSGESINPVLVQHAHETILDSALSL